MYRLLYLGLIMMIDIRIMNFDILPDIIGYIFIYKALTNLKDRSKYFSNALLLTVPLMIASVFDIVSVYEQGTIFTAVSLVMTAINLGHMICICLGMSSDLLSKGHSQLSKMARSRIVIYSINMVILVSATFINLEVLNFIGFMCYALAFILLLNLFGGTSKVMDLVES